MLTVSAPAAPKTTSPTASAVLEIAPSPISKWSRRSPSTSEMRSSTRPTPPTTRNGRSNDGGLSARESRGRMAAGGFTLSAREHPRISAACIDSATDAQEAAGCRTTRASTAASPRIRRMHATTSSTTAGVSAGQTMLCGPNASSPPARMRMTSQPTSRSASSFSRSDASLRPDVRASRAPGIVVLDRDAQLRHEDVGPDLLAPEERARDAHRVHAVVQPDALGEQHPEPLLGLRRARAQPGIHEGHAPLAQRARAGGVRPRTWGTPDR